MKVLIVGDCHGYEGMLAANDLALDLDCDAVVQLGDCWRVEMSMDVPFHVIPGNHEQWRLWAEGEFGEKVIAHTDYTTFELGGRKFGVIGRIDDMPSIRQLMTGGLNLGEPDKIFFARLEGQQVRDALGESDVLLFHDAPFPFVLGHRPVPNNPDWITAGPRHPEIIGSPYLNEVVRAVHPTYAFHGHMHLLDIRYIGPTRVYGLPPIDPVFAQRGYAILETRTMRVRYVDL
jgi:Icc-related predicted phosphoesterase